MARVIISSQSPIISGAKLTKKRAEQKSSVLHFHCLSGDLLNNKDVFTLYARTRKFLKNATLSLNILLNNLLSANSAALDLF